MERRHFIRAGGAIATAVIAGCAGDEAAAPALPEEQATDDEPGNDEPDDANAETNGFPVYDLPGYSDWIPAESHDADEAVFFTHLDWESLDPLEEVEDAEDHEDAEEIIEHVPIVGLALFGGLITPLAFFAILSYPFAGDLIPDDDEAVEGIDTTTSTYAEDLLILRGEFDVDVFEAEYAEGFDHEERDGFTVFVGAEDETDGLAYAVTEDTLLVGMQTVEERTPADVVNAALDRYLDEADRMIDEEEGRWLLETTGQAQMAFGGWEIENLREAIEDDDVNESDLDAELEDNPVFDSVESLSNTLVFGVEDGEIGDIEARYSGIYPDGEVPTEDDVREYLIGEEEVTHTIVIEGNRVHASATFEAVPE